MNPFDLRGPEFLLFYALLAGAVLASLYLLRRFGDQETPPRIDPRDPYLIAYLRGGRLEALRVAILSLIDRGLLKVHNSEIETEDHPTTTGLVRRPIEKAVLDQFKSPRTIEAVVEDVAPGTVWAQEYEKELMRSHLLPDEEAKRSQQRRFLVAAFLLAGVAFYKIVVALSRGRFNITFLILLAVGAVVMIYKVSHPSRTPLGDRLLTKLGEQFESLKLRVSELPPGGHTNALAMAAALFGLGVVPAESFPAVKMLRPRQPSSSGGGCGSSCGSSCGGGGCGGGGGGCGG